METSIVRPRTPRRKPVAALGKVTAAALLGLALALLYLQAVVGREFRLDLMIFVGLMLAGASIVATGWRWAPLLGALLSLLIVAGNGETVIYDLTHPELIQTFAFMVVSVALALTGLVAGIGASVQNYWYAPADRHTPRWLPAALASVAVVSLGAILVAALIGPPAAAINPEELADLPALTTPGFQFNQTQLVAWSGESVSLRLDNTHNAPHSFDIDELNVHIAVGPGKSALVRFTPAEPGTYIYYCAVPGHRELGMEGTLIVEGDG